MQTPPSPQPPTQPDLNQVLTPAAPPVPEPAPAPTTQTVLVTEQQLAGELGGLVSPTDGHRGRRWWLWLIIIVVIGVLIWLALANNWFGGGTSSNSTLDNAATGLDSTPPVNTATNTTDASNTATNSAATTDLTTATGRDAARRDRLNLFVDAARTAVTNHINLPITTAPVKLNDSTNATVANIRQLLKDQNVSDATIDEYLTDPSPDKYYFGYNYDGQFLTLTAVLEVAGTDCTATTTPTGQICVLKKVVEL